MAQNDISNPDFLLAESNPYVVRSGIKRLSGRGTVTPGYRVRGEQPGASAEGVQNVTVLKITSPLSGQGPASPLATGRYANYNLNVVGVNRIRVARSVPPNQNSKVVRPKLTSIRRLDGKGQGTVSYI